MTLFVGLCKLNEADVDFFKCYDVNGINLVLKTMPG
jgi:hypothetical protein